MLHFRSCILAAITFLGSAAIARADEILSYTGKDFTQAFGAYTTSDYISGTITLSSALPDNCNECLISDVVSFSFSDGVQTITNNTPNVVFTFDVNTNSAGQITGWNLGAEIPHTPDSIRTNNNRGLAFDNGELDEFDVAQNVRDAGEWQTKAVPEPASVTLLGGVDKMIDA